MLFWNVNEIVGARGTCSPEHPANRWARFLAYCTDRKVRQSRNCVHQVTLGDPKTATEGQSLRPEPGPSVSADYANQLCLLSGSSTQRDRVEHQRRHSQ